jgi:class 3 adenylate cyclase/tetratricopeptide (TPR) repeat protein/ABC-type oligopeptide transport system ATPase subunit
LVRAAAPEERKVVSILFVDLVEFTSRSDRADPEDVRDMLVPYYTRVKSEIESFGGIVEKFIGDAVMAVFGAPVAHGDDAERAVRAGLRVLEAIDELNREHPELDLTVRAAVNTGEAIVDARSQPDISEGLAHGDVVNTASRMQTGALPGTLIVGKETYRATRTVIEYRPIDAVVAKGKRDPLAAWQATGTLTEPAERAVSAAPMVGRDPELGLLRTTWEAVLTERRPHLVTVVGPPGIGKTRLTREVVQLVEQTGGRVLIGRSLPYGEGSGYRAFARQVRLVAGIFQSDPPDEARRKLTAAVDELFRTEEASEVAEHLAILTGLGTEQVPDRQPLFFSARRFVEQLANKQPVLMVFEDIHWSDPSQLDLMESLASRVRDAPVMFLALTRPDIIDVRPAWGAGVPAAATMELRPLSTEDAWRLAERLLPIKEGVTSAVRRLVETAEGNPLFIEELAASLTERVEGAAAALPTNVKTTIASRLDVLPPEARAVLLDAAVVGKVFWSGALAAMADGRDRTHLEDALDLLEARDFIHRETASQIEGDHEYTFRHMLILEVAYTTLPRAARRARHAAVARFITNAAGERVAEVAALLAHHWREAGEDDRARDSLIMAAEHAAHGWAKGEAVKLYRQALELVPQDQADLRREINLRQAETLVVLGDLPPAISILDDLLPELDGPDRVFALLNRGQAAYWSMDAAVTRTKAQEALELAERLNDREMIGPAYSLASFAASMQGDMEKAFELSDRATATWVPERRNQALAMHLDQRGLDHYWTGDYPESENAAREAMSIAEEVRSTESLLRSGGVVGLALIGQGRHEEAIAIFDDVITRGRETEFVPRWTARTLNMSSLPFRELYDLDEARRRNEEAAELGARAGFAMAEIQSAIDQVFLDLLEYEPGRAHSRMPRLIEQADAAKGWHQWLMRGRLAEAAAEIALAKGDAEAAAAAADKAIQEATAVSRRKYETAARLVLGRALLQMKQHDQAVAELRAALAGAERLIHPPTVWRAWSSLSEALAQTADDRGAGEAYEKAVGTLRAFAGRLAPERAERLLRADPVQEILGSA